MANVLIVDSSLICRELLGRILEVNGYATLWASPEEAAERLREAAPDVMILDPGPAESPGWRFLNDLRRDGATAGSTHIIILTDQAAKEDVLRAVKLGLRDYMLKKRFSMSELLVRIQRYTVAGGKPTSSPMNIPGGTSSSENAEPDAPNALEAGAKSASPTGPHLGSAFGRATVPFAAPNVAVNEGTNLGKLTEAAKELGVAFLTRDQTLELLESAPVKTLPGVVAELISLVNSPRGTVADVAQILRRDPVMTARVLRMANSAAFASHRASIATVEDAVKNIGVEGVHNLVVNVGIFDVFAANGSDGIRLTRVWQHSLGVAMLMEKLAPRDPSVPPGSAYLVGLCHDLPDIVLRQHFSTQYAAIEALAARTGFSLRYVEGIAFGLPYADLVSHLLAQLGLPPIITVPIEEFFERSAVKSAAGAGSLLARTLRSMNVYAHGLMLAPDNAEPLTPLTRSESANTFGDKTLSSSDAEKLRSEALTTACDLAGLTPSQTKRMCASIIPEQPVKVCYSRHVEFSALDPLATFLGLAARELSMLPPLKAIKPDSLRGADALIVAGPRTGAAELIAQQLDHIGSLVSTAAIPVLYLAGSDIPATAAKGTTMEVHTLPISIERLGQFLARIPKA